MEEIKSLTFDKIKATPFHQYTRADVEEILKNLVLQAKTESNESVALAIRFSFSYYRLKTLFYSYLFYGANHEVVDNALQLFRYNINTGECREKPKTSVNTAIKSFFEAGYGTVCQKNLYEIMKSQELENNNPYFIKWCYDFGNQVVWDKEELKKNIFDLPVEKIQAGAIAHIKKVKLPISLKWIYKKLDNGTFELTEDMDIDALFENLFCYYVQNSSNPKVAELKYKTSLLQLKEVGLKPKPKQEAEPFDEFHPFNTTNMNLENLSYYINMYFEQPLIMKTVINKRRRDVYLELAKMNKRAQLIINNNTEVMGRPMSLLDYYLIMENGFTAKQFVEDARLLNNYNLRNESRFTDDSYLKGYQIASIINGSKTIMLEDGRQFVIDRAASLSIFAFFRKTLCTKNFKNL